MSTLERDASAAWSALRNVWPDLAWANPVYRHGAFHHVVVLESTSVVRMSFAGNHQELITRNSTTVRVISDARLTTRVPHLLRVHTGDAWSAMACTYVEGAHGTDRPWDDVRDSIAAVIDDLRSARIPPSSLPPVRAWCGAASWPDLVERITLESSAAVKDAARGIVREVMSLDEAVVPSLVHGDFGSHNILWDSFGRPGLIDFDNACVADPAVDVAPLIGFYGAVNVEDIVDADVLSRAKVLRASLPLQVAAAAALGGDSALQDHALSNFTRRLEAGSLYDPAAAA
jgi:aminoglycoside phosphotransferase (APT) family kinase protein